MDTEAIRPDKPNRSMKGFRLLRLAGFDVRLNLTWLILGFLIAWTLAMGLFPTDYPELSPETYWWMGIAGAIGILISIVLHELSHSIVARFYGLPIKGITLFLFGGIAEMEEEPKSPKVEFLMAVAGPVASVVVAAGFFLVERAAIVLGWSTPVIGVSHYLAVVNLLLAAFNLVPAFPLDGGRMFRAALWQWKGDLLSATRIASRFGSGFGLALIILGFFGLLQGNFIGGMWWILIGAFLRGAATVSYRQLVVRDMLEDQPIRNFMIEDPITVPSSATIEEFLNEYVYRHYFKLFPVVDDGDLRGCVVATDIRDIPREQWSDVKISKLIRSCSPENTLSPNASAANLVKSMMNPSEAQRYMVVDNGRLLGVVALKDLHKFISLRMELENPLKTPG